MTKTRMASPSMCFLMSLGVLTSFTRRSLQTVAQQKFRSVATMSSPLDKIPDVNIDGNGIFKYILVHIHDDVNKQSKPIVRGYARCTWHARIPAKLEYIILSAFHSSEDCSKNNIEIFAVFGPSQQKSWSFLSNTSISASGKCLPVEYFIDNTKFHSSFREIQQINDRRDVKLFLGFEDESPKDCCNRQRIVGITGGSLTILHFTQQPCLRIFYKNEIHKSMDEQYLRGQTFCILA